MIQSKIGWKYFNDLEYVNAMIEDESSTLQSADDIISLQQLEHDQSYKYLIIWKIHEE